MSMRLYSEETKKGLVTEARFDEIAAKYGWEKNRDAIGHEQTRQHWDKLVEHLNQQFKIEVKDEKATKRGEKKQSMYFLLELHGIAFNENEGWIYGSIADYIAFLYENSFRLFTRIDLIKFIADKIGVRNAFDPLINAQRILSPTYPQSPHHPTIKPYQIYHRYKNNSNIDQKDAFIWVPAADLLQLDHITFKDE